MVDQTIPGRKSAKSKPAHQKRFVNLPASNIRNYTSHVPNPDTTNISKAIAVFMQWAQLPITNEEYAAQQLKGQEGIFSSAQLLPGVAELLQTLDRLQIPIALATSSDQRRFTLKTTHLQKEFSVFKPEHRVVGDDKRITPGRGKPCPDIYLLALKTLNDARLARGDTDLIKPEECLVFEDAVLGVEAGRRAGMQVVWCPHPKLYEIYASRTKEVLAGGTNDHQRTGDIGDVPQGQIDDGYARYMSSLADFPYADYGIRT